MSGPRNRQAVAVMEARRAQIAAVMLERVRTHPLLPPLSGKAMQERFPDLSLSTILEDIKAIHAAAKAEVEKGHAIGRDFSSSLPV
jgi:hypothetical protein